MFRCNHHHQGAHYLSLLKLHFLKQSIKIHCCVYFNWPYSSKRRPGRLWGPTQPPSVKRRKREAHQSYTVTRLRIPPVLQCVLMGLMRITLPAYSAIISLPEVAVLFAHNFSLPLFALNPLNLELNPICYLLALLGAHHFLHVSRIRVKSITLRRLMSHIYGAPILDVSRSHTTTQHSR